MQGGAASRTVRRADGGDEVGVARIGRICEKCRGGGLGEGMGKCDGVRVYGATLQGYLVYKETYTKETERI